MSERTEEIRSNSTRAQGYLAIAIAAEFVYLAGRTLILPCFDEPVSMELAVTAWRVPFVFIYAWIFLVGFAGKVAKRAVPSHPLLWGGVILVLLAGPPAWGETEVDRTTIVFILTTPIVALREELFYRAILCGFRTMPGCHSGACRAGIPVHAGLPFRSMPGRLERVTRGIVAPFYLKGDGGGASEVTHAEDSGGLAPQA